MAFRHARAVAVLLAMLPSAHLSAEPFVFDKGYTALIFSWSHLGLSRQQARFNTFDGTIDIDPQNPEKSSVDVTIRTASVQSGVDAFDRILRGPDYFDATAFPAITFRSTAVKRTGEKTAEVVGELNIRGRGVPLALAVKLNVFGAHPSGDGNPAYAGKKVAAFSAQSTALRSAWGLERGTPFVSDEIEISIETELIGKD